MKKEIKDLLEKADRYLRSAELLLKDGDFDSCASRCYYAMFYSAEAILVTNDLKASSHKGVISLFGEHFIKTGKLDKELGKALRRAYDLRQKGDYETGFMVTEEEARKLLGIAKNFVKAISDYLSEKNGSK